MNDTLKIEFTQRIVELQSRVESIHEDFAEGKAATWSEQAGDRENDEVLNALESEAKIEIQKLSNAILSIEAGTYGICSECNQKIAKARLKVQPSATKCIKCAE